MLHYIVCLGACSGTWQDASYYSLSLLLLLGAHVVQLCLRMHAAPFPRSESSERIPVIESVVTDEHGREIEQKG
jgi:hypothetical protein